MSTATMTITRTFPDDGPDDVDIEVTLSGTYVPAEPDVGIMSDGFIDIYAEDESGNEVDLTEGEKDLAQEALLGVSAEDAADARENAAESRADARRFWREHNA